MTAFPFTAIVGQDDLREALLACAVEPAIGGVLVRGERGTAKTTAVRGLAPLLPAIREGGDEGTPIVIRDPGSEVALSFNELARKVVQRISALASRGLAAPVSIGTFEPH